MKMIIATLITMAAILLTATMTLATTQPTFDMNTHHRSMMGMMNGYQNSDESNWKAMHELCERTMGTEEHEECEQMMESGHCTMMG